MAGKSHSGAEMRGSPRGSDTRSRLMTALKLFFWFSVLCMGLVSLASFYAYKHIKRIQARQEQYQNSHSPVPASPVEVMVERPAESPGSAETPRSEGIGASTMPAGNEAASADTPLTGPHASARTAAGIVINEIFFHPQSSQDMPEDPRQEFIELHNAGMSDIPLEGHRLKKGVKYTFPAHTLPAGGYVVVAANPDVFSDQHPDVTSVVGGWNGKLSNSGEEIELENADGKKVDSVRYSDGGDWASRRAGAARARKSRGGGFIFRSRSSRGSRGPGGWEWQNPADGDGFSLELRSAGVTNQNGQNWRPSAERGGTPGRRNSAYSPDIAPVIANARHRPVIPSPDDPVTISATIKDELDTGISAELFWRVSDERSNGTFKAEPMTAEGNRFKATIPAQQHEAIVEFFVRATDGVHSRTWPAATDRGQAANALFQVEVEADEPAPGFALYRLVMTRQDHQNFQRMSRHTDAQVNATLIADDGDGPIVRYSCGVRYRGAGSRNHHPTPMRVNLPGDQPWHGSTKMNLNSKYSWLQFIGMKIFADAGERAPDVKPVTVRGNGQNLMNNGGGGNGRAGGFRSQNPVDYGYYVHAEPLGGEWVENHFPEDAGGNCYKKVRPDTDWAYRQGRADRYLQDGWSKTSSAAAADWSDLDGFLRVMNKASRDDDYLLQVRDVADLEQWHRWFGINALIANREGGLAKGVDDDYGLYRGEDDRRFHLLPHDLDTILAHSDRSRRTDAYHTLFDFAEGGERIGPLEELFDQQQVRRDYLAQIHELLESTFASGHFDALLRNHLGEWVPDHELLQIISWMNSRRVYAASEVEVVLGRNAIPRLRPESLGSMSQAPPAELRINEIMAAGTDTAPDFIELHNGSNIAVDASGCRLTDNAKKPDKYALPEGTIIQPGGFLVVTEDDCGFRLEASGESVLLFPREGEEPLDSIVFGLQARGHSIGRVDRIGGDGSDWTLNQPTPAAANIGQPLGDPAMLCINEWLVHPHVKFDTDFVELFNKDAQPVALGGLHITDDPFNYPERFSVPPLSFMNGNAFVMFKAAGSNASKSDARQLPMKFAYEHGNIRVSGSNGVRIDQINYQCHRRDISQGRSRDGGDRFTYYSDPTPGSSNTAPPREDADGHKALAGGLRISEIMFHPIGHSGLEFIELTNAGTATLNLKGVRFTKGIDFEFDDDFDLAPGACAVIAANTVEFAAEYGENIPVAGEFKGKLSNGGETIQLKLPKPSEALILSVEFNDKWQINADGLGKSLVLKDPRLSREACAESAAWKASAEDKGSPGRME